MRFIPLQKKHTWFHRHNPFNRALENHLKNTLGALLNPATTFTSPVLNQGNEPYCAEYADAATVAAITEQSCDPLAILQNVLSYLNQTQDEYQGSDLTTAMTVIVNPGTPTYHYDALLYIYPQANQSFCEAINQSIQLYKRPANLGGAWFNEFFSAQNGIITTGANNLAGGHDMMLCGIGEDGYMDNQGSWGTDAPGSIQGHYKFSPQVFDSYYTGYPCAIGINSDSSVVQILGKMSSLYVKIIDLIGSLGNKLSKK